MNTFLSSAINTPPGAMATPGWLTPTAIVLLVLIVASLIFVRVPR